MLFFGVHVVYFCESVFCQCLENFHSICLQKTPSLTTDQHQRNEMRGRIKICRKCKKQSSNAAKFLPTRRRKLGRLGQAGKEPLVLFLAKKHSTPRPFHQRCPFFGSKLPSDPLTEATYFSNSFTKRLQLTHNISKLPKQLFFP